MPDRVSYFKMIHLFKIRLGLAPPYLSSGFVSLLRTHSYRTRGSESNYHISREIALSPTSFTFTAIKTWNGLPVQLKRLDSLPNFKKKLKEFLISRYWNYGLTRLGLLLDVGADCASCTYFFFLKLLFLLLWDPVVNKSPDLNRLSLSRWICWQFPDCSLPSLVKINSIQFNTASK